MGYTGRRWRGGWASDAQGSNTVVPPYLHRGSAARARVGNAECRVQNAECGMAARLGAGGRVTGVSCGTALRRNAFKELYLSAVFPRVQAWSRSKAANSLVNSALRN